MSRFRPILDTSKPLYARRDLAVAGRAYVRGERIDGLADERLITKMYEQNRIGHEAPMVPTVAKSKPSQPTR